MPMSAERLAGLTQKFGEDREKALFYLEEWMRDGVYLGVRRWATEYQIAVLELLAEVREWHETYRYRWHCDACDHDFATASESVMGCPCCGETEVVAQMNRRD